MNIRMAEIRWRRGLHAAFGADFNDLAGALMLGLQRLVARRRAPEMDPAVLEETLEAVRFEPVAVCSSLVCNCPSCIIQTGMVATLDTHEDQSTSQSIFGQKILKSKFSGVGSLTFAVAFNILRGWSLWQWPVYLGLATAGEHNSRSIRELGLWRLPASLFEETQGVCVVMLELVPATGRLTVFHIIEGSCVALMSKTFTGEVFDYFEYDTPFKYHLSHPWVKVFGLEGTVQILRC